MLLESQIVSASLVAARVSGVVLFAPFLSSAAVPVRVKAVTTVLITVVLLPSQPAPGVAMMAGGWVLGLVKELAVGAVLGLCMAMVFEAANIAGQVLGFQLGFSLVNVIDPQTQIDTPVLANFHQTVVMLIFLQLNVHHWMLRSLAKTFALVPSGSGLVPSIATSALLHLAGGMWIAAVQVAAPALIATMVADVAVGLLGKASPSLPLLSIALPVKTALGLGLIGGALAFWPQIFEPKFAAAIDAAERIAAGR